MRPDSCPVEERIKKVLAAELDISPAVLASSDSRTMLLGHGIGLDSIEAMALALALESEFDLNIPDQDLTVDLFKDIGSLTDYFLQRVK